MELTLSIVIGGITIGLAAGMLTGIFGLGGGFLMAPALMIILKVPADVAIGTNLAAKFVNSSFGMLKRRGKQTIDVKLGLTIAAGSVVGALFGDHLLQLLKHAPQMMILGKEQDPAEYALLCMYLPLLAYIAAYVLFEYKQTSGKALGRRIGLLSRCNIPPYANYTSLDDPRMSVTMLMIVGFCIGTLTGLMGVSGVLMLPALIYIIGQHAPKAAGTNLMLVLILSLVAVIPKSISGQVDLMLFIMLIIGGLTGTYFGTKIGLKLTGPKIRLYFVYVVIAGAVIVAYKLYQLTF